MPSPTESYVYVCLYTFTVTNLLIIGKKYRKTILLDYKNVGMRKNIVASSSKIKDIIFFIQCFMHICMNLKMFFST